MIWLIGSGPMSVDYAKIIDAQEYEYLVIGRGSSSANEFYEKTGKHVVVGGLKSFLSSKPDVASSVIVCVGVEHLFEITLELIEYGVKNILVEKPGGLNSREIQHIYQKSLDNRCDVYIAYNRRFYASTLEAKKRIEADGGVKSFSFEVTEWAHVIDKLNKPKSVLERWFLANSSHVVDLAFYLGGKPKEIASYVSGELRWHPSASIFAGAGISESGALFSYSANWESAGRWSVEILTNENRYIFRPIEILQVQKKGSIAVEDLCIDDPIDRQYKAGLYKQVEAFLAKDILSLCSIAEQVSIFSVYERMAGYNEA